MISFLRGRVDHSIRGLAARRARALFARIGAAVVLICVAPLQSCTVVGQVTEPASDNYEVPAAIDATGTNDVTTDLLAFFASVPDGSTISFPSSATYRIENTLLVKNRNNLTFEGNGVTFIANTDGSGVVPDPLIKGPPPGNLGAWPRGRRHWMFYGGSGIVIRNMTIRGAHPNGPSYVGNREAQHGIEMSGVVGGDISNVTITDVYGDFIYLGNVGTTWASNITIHNNTMARGGRQGIAISGAQDVLIDSNNISTPGRAVLDIEPTFGTTGAKRITFRNNAVGASGGYFFANVGNGTATVEDITIENNVLTGNSLQMVIGSPTMTVRRARFIVRNNTGDRTFGSPHPLMTFYRVDGLVVTGNTNPIQIGQNGVAVMTQEVCQAQVSGNTFLNAVQDWLDNPWTGCP